MKVTTVYTECPYITAGKEYEVREDYVGNYWVVTDIGNEIFINLSSKGSGHLHGETWTVIDNE